MNRREKRQRKIAAKEHKERKETYKNLKDGFSSFAN